MIHVASLLEDAYQCLLPLDHEALDIEALSYDFAAFFLKPGHSFLQSLDSFSDYVATKQTVVLNASKLKPFKQGEYAVSSVQTGAKLSVQSADLCALFKQLKPDLVILPQQFTRPAQDFGLMDLKSTQFFFDSRDDWHAFSLGQAGLYFYSDQIPSKFNLKSSHIPLYLISNLSLEQLHTSRSIGFQYLETARPAMDASKALVYTQSGSVHLKDLAHLHEPLDELCACRICQQKFTKAYLYHLFQQVPLLCQRFLTYHNAYVYNKKMRSYVNK